MTVDSIFKLEPILDNPIYEGLACPELPSLLGRERLWDDFFPLKREDWNWEPSKLKSVWKVPEVLGRTAAFNDYPCLSMMVPAFSRRAVEALADILEPNGELLPLRHPAGEFFVFNCQKVVEILDQSNCKGSWIGSRKPPACAGHISYFAVITERVQGLSIFKLRELCNQTFVTNVFVDRVRKEGLNGFEFVKAWPLPPDTDFQLEHEKQRDASLHLVNTEKGLLEVKRQSIVIEFVLNEGKMTKDEKKLLARYEDELDAQLFVKRIDGEYHGSLEGRKTAKGKTKLYLSCPDAELLLTKLHPWLKEIQWQPRPKVYLRDEPFQDFEAIGRLVEI